MSDDDVPTKIAVCSACDQIMHVAATCDLAKRGGVIPFGEEFPELEYPDECHDCAVVLGGVHHPFCCVAFCGNCNEQRLLCGCDDDEDD